MKKKIGLVALLVATAGAMSLTSCNDNKQTEDNTSKIKAMQGSITNLETKINDVDSTLTQKITDEIKKLNDEKAKADTTINTKIDQAIATLRGEIEMAGAQTASKAASDLAAARTALEELIASNKTTLEAKDAEQDVEIEDLKGQDTTLDAKIDAAETALKAVDTALQGAIDTINAAITSLKSADTTLDNKIDGINDSLLEMITELEGKINQASVTQQELDDAVDALEATDTEIKADIAGLKADITTINGKITTINGTLTAYGNRITTLETNVALLQSADATTDEKITAIEEAIATLQEADETLDGRIDAAIEDLSTDITALETAAATKEALQAQVTALTAVDTELRGLITTLRGQFDQAVIDYKAKDQAHDDAIATINDEIDTITQTLEEHAETIAEIIEDLGDRSTVILDMLEEFYGEESRDQKAQYVYNLSQTYADFQNELAKIKTDLIEAFTIDGQISAENNAFVNKIYDKLYDTSNRQMLGFLYKGIEYITLAPTLEEAEAAYKEYDEKLESFINEAKFYVIKETGRQKVDELITLPLETQEEILGWIEDIEYKTEDTLDMTAAQVEEYYNIRISKIYLYTGWAQAIDEIYKAKNAAYEIIEGYKKDPEDEVGIKGLTAAEIETLEDMIDDSMPISAYYEIGAEIHEATTELAEQTYSEALRAINTQFAEDRDEIDLIRAEAKAYYDLTGVHNSNYKNIQLFVVNITATEKKYFEDIIAAYHDLDRYTDSNLKTKEDVQTLYDADKFAVDIYAAQAIAYDGARGHEADLEAMVSDLENGLLAIKATERTSINELLAATAKFDEYKVEVGDEGAFESIEALGTKCLADKATATLLYAQAVAYNRARAYDLHLEFEVDGDQNDQENYPGLKAITADERTAIKSLLAGTVLYADYINAEALTDTAKIEAKRQGDVDAMTLIFNQADAYNDVRAFDQVVEEGITTQCTNISTTDKNAILELMAAIPQYNQYVQAEGLTDVTKIIEKHDADQAAIYFLAQKAVAYDDVIGLIATTNAEIRDLTNLTVTETIDQVEVKGEQEKFIALVSAISVYDDYIVTPTNKTALDTLVDENNATIALILTQATQYNIARGYDKEQEAVVSAYENIISTEKESINALIAAVPTYEAYVATTTIDEATTLTTTNKAAMDFIKFKADKYNTINGTVDAAVKEDGTIDSLEFLTTTIGEVKGEKETLIELITAIPTYSEYIDAETEDATTALLTGDTAAIQLILDQARAYDEARGLTVAAQNYVDDLENIEEMRPAELETIKEKMYLIHTFAEYLATQTKAEVYAMASDNALMLNVISYQASRYNQILGILKSHQTTVDGLDNLTKTITTDDSSKTEKEIFKDFLEGYVQYDNYIVEIDSEDIPHTLEAVDTLKADIDDRYDEDKDDLDFTLAQAQTYNDDRGFEKTIEEHITDYFEYIPDGEENNERAAINVLLDGSMSYLDYLLTFDELELETIHNQKTTLVEFIYHKAVKYEAALEYAVLTNESIESEMIGYVDEQVIPGTIDNLISEGDLTTLFGLVNAIPQYNSYLANENLTTNDLVNAQYEADCDAMNKILYQACRFDELLVYIRTKKAAIAQIETSLEEITLINTSLDAIPVLANYTGKTNAKVDEQLAADKVKVDLLEVRIQTLKAIQDYIELSDAKIDGYTVETEGGVFKPEDKTSLKELYAPYGTVEVFDGSVAEFTTAEAYAGYLETVKAYIDLVAVTAATTFRDIINHATINNNALDANEILTDELKTAFKANISAYTVYADCYDDVKLFTTAAEFTTYYNNVKAKIKTVMDIAAKEVELINYRNARTAEIETKKTNGDITVSEMTYLQNVITSIYDAYTNIEQTDLTVVTTRVTTAETQMDNVINKVANITSVDNSIATLNNSLTNYISDAEDYFLATFNEPVYHDAKDVWDDNIDEINAKANEAKYNYVLPNTNTYEAFVTFINSLMQPTTITNRLSILSSWYENEDDLDEDGIEDGMLYQMIAEFSAKDATRIVEARTTYLGKLEEKYDYYLGFDGTDTTLPNYTSLRSSLKLIYNTWKAKINQAVTTAEVISSYETGIGKLDEAVLDTCKTFYLAKFSAAIEDAKAAHPSIADALDGLSDTWQGYINASDTTTEVAANYGDAIDALAEMLEG